MSTSVVRNISLFLALGLAITVANVLAQKPNPKKKSRQKARATANQQDAKNRKTGKPEPARDPEFQQYGIYESTAPRAATTEAIETALPLKLNKGDRIALIGNTLLERSQLFGPIETLLHQRYPAHQLIVRNLGWPADTPDQQPRPDNFADLEQHLTHEKVDVILAAFGFNESFDGEEGLEAFTKSLTAFVERARTRAFNGKSAPRIVLLSPIANENVEGVRAADLNNDRIVMYAKTIHEVAAKLDVAYVDVFHETEAAMGKPWQRSHHQRLSSYRGRVRPFREDLVSAVVRREGAGNRRSGPLGGDR